MNNMLKDAFDQVHADEDLKERTKEYLFRRTKGYTRAGIIHYRRFIPAAACFAFLLCGSWMYFTPTAEISIDINPSVELGVNRFDRVISVKGYNDDGKELAGLLDIKYMNCADAVAQILQDEEIITLLSDDEIMAIGVIGEEDNAQTVRILAELQICTEEEANTFCYAAHEADREEAHDMGLSCGKYRAFLELQELDPTVTADEVGEMTMREIYDRISELSQNSGVDDAGETNGNMEGNGNAGEGNGAGYNHHGNHEEHEHTNHE